MDICHTILLNRLARAVALTLATGAATVAAAAPVSGASATSSASSLIFSANGATLSVQRPDTTAKPQVRSVQRDASDNEKIVAGARETVEVLLADGTSLTLAPGSRVVLERYRYDRASRLGELQLRIEAGAARFVGGVLNNSSAVVVKTPNGSAALDNAVAFVRVDDSGSEFALVAGRGITVQGTVESRTLSKSGSAAELDAGGAFAGETRSLNRNEQLAYSKLVNPGLASGVVPTFVVDNRAPASSAVVVDTDSRADEDAIAKDDKLGPQLPDPIAPAGACSAGSCLAGAPSFDLATSIGDINNRQTGRTTGAVWQRQYVQGDPVAVDPNRLLRGFEPDFSSATDGQRTTTARIFAANAGSPFSLTFGAANPPLSGSSFAALTCFESTSGGCQGSPIVNVYDGADGARYRVAGLSGGFPASLATDMFLTLSGGMTFGDFGAYPILAPIPIDLDRPGAVTSRSINETVNGCVQGDDTSCTRSYGTDQDRADDINSAGFFSAFQPQLSGSSPLSLFSQYFVGVNLTEETFGSSTNYLATVVFSGQSAYDVSSLQAGFHRVPIRNYESSVNTICAQGSASCDFLAIDLFGPQFPNDLLSPPAINRDLTDPFFNPDFPPFGQFTADVMVRDLDSFLALDMISRLPGDTQRLFYATGSVSGRLPGAAAAQGATLDSFHLSAGLDASVSGGRAFLRPDTLLGIAPAALLSSDLRVLNAPYATTIGSPSRALHYDFAAAGNGTGQTSTISVTLGTLTYSTASNSAQFAGRTVGSTARAGASRYSGSVQSALLSTAIGGGNPNIASTGRAGYLVLENYDPVSAPSGGLERTIENGTATQTQYANLRLAQIRAGGSQAAPANRANQALTGYAAGLAEVTAANGASVELAALSSQSFQLATNAVQGTAGAAFTASVGNESAALNFGSLAGASGLSAYTGAKEFAAMTAATPNLAAGAVADATSANAAIVSGAPLIGSASQGWTSEIDAATRTSMGTNAANTSGYRYLQWGFFFGDFATSGGRAAHSHLTSWVAGRATPEGTPLPGGTASYAGHVFANVSNGNQLYSAAGTFANQWNFATRSGNGTMSFDGDDYSFVTRLLGLQRNGSQVTSTSTARFEGLISTSDDPGYVGSLNGSFAADPAATTDPLALRSGVMGQFNLSRTRDGNPYRAVGTFAGELQGQGQ